MGSTNPCRSRLSSADRAVWSKLPLPATYEYLEYQSSNTRSLQGSQSVAFVLDYSEVIPTHTAL